MSTSYRGEQKDLKEKAKEMIGMEGRGGTGRRGGESGGGIGSRLGERFERHGMSEQPGYYEERMSHPSYESHASYGPYESKKANVLPQAIALALALGSSVVATSSALWFLISRANEYKKKHGKYLVSGREGKPITEKAKEALGYGGATGGAIGGLLGKGRKEEGVPEKEHKEFKEEGYKGKGKLPLKEKLKGMFKGEEKEKGYGYEEKPFTEKAKDVLGTAGIGGATGGAIGGLLGRGGKEESGYEKEGLGYEKGKKRMMEHEKGHEKEGRHVKGRSLKDKISGFFKGGKETHGHGQEEKKSLGEKTKETLATAGIGGAAGGAAGGLMGRGGREEGYEREGYEREGMRREEGYEKPWTERAKEVFSKPMEAMKSRDIGETTSGYQHIPAQIKNKAEYLRHGELAHPSTQEGFVENR